MERNASDVCINAEPEARAIDNELARADCQSAIQPINNRRYSVAQTGSLLYRRLLTGYGSSSKARKPWCLNPAHSRVEESRPYRFESAAGSCFLAWLTVR